MLRVIFAFSLLFAAACAGMRTPIPDESSSEAQLYMSKCGRCHSVPHPKRHTFREWEHWMTVMEKIMQQRNFSPMSADEKNTILSYLKQHAR